MQFELIKVLKNGLVFTSCSKNKIVTEVTSRYSPNSSSVPHVLKCYKLLPCFFQFISNEPFSYKQTYSEQNCSNVN